MRIEKENRASRKDRFIGNTIPEIKILILNQQI